MPHASEDRSWLSLLACPACRTGLQEAKAELICGTCGRCYPIRNGIPQLLLEDARPAASAPGNPQGQTDQHDTQ